MAEPEVGLKAIFYFYLKVNSQVWSMKWASVQKSTYRCVLCQAWDKLALWFYSDYHLCSPPKETLNSQDSRDKRDTDLTVFALCTWLNILCLLIYQRLICIKCHFLLLYLWRSAWKLIFIGSINQAHEKQYRGSLTDIKWKRRCV